MKLKEKDFTTVILAFHGVAKFQLPGDYFKQLGKEFATQNPLYTMRTFAEHVQHTDGTPAYGKVEGGWLGVRSEEMGQIKDLEK